MIKTNKRILVTGGAGFLGSNLCDRLIGQGHDVICLDNLQTGSKANIQHLLGHSSFEFIRHDIVNPIRLEVDEIYNLACPASPPRYQKNPISTLKTNVLGAINVLGIAKRCGAKVFQASTSEIYGEPIQHPQTESYFGNVNPIGIRSCYDEGKRVAETLFFDYHRTHHVDIRVARIFNTYGPRMALDDGRVVSNLVVQAITGNDFTIYGDGLQTRSFCYVDDLIDGFLSLMNQDLVIGPVNLGNPTEFTMLELVHLLQELTHSSAKIQFFPRPQDDPTKRRPDITQAKKMLGFEPKIQLKEGLQFTINHFKSCLKNAINE